MPNELCFAYPKWDMGVFSLGVILAVYSISLRDQDNLKEK